MTKAKPDPLTEVIEAAKALAVQVQGADESSIEVSAAERVTWSDGSLGCPEEGMVYTQALVDGYWIVLSTSVGSLDYRSDLSGRLRLCRDGEPPFSINPVS